MALTQLVDDPLPAERRRRDLERLRAWPALRQRCPECGVAPGVPCFTATLPDGRDAFYAHVSRPGAPQPQRERLPM